MLGKKKVFSAKKQMEALNPFIQVETYPFLFSAENACRLIEKYDFIIDATDNFQSKILIGELCKKYSCAYTSAGVSQFKGQVFSSTPNQYSSWKDFFPNISAQQALSCAEIGVFSPTCSIIGSLQAGEALKYLLNLGKLLTHSILVYDALSNQFSLLKMKN